MKTIKVSEATNTQLNWLVAKCEGLKPNTDYRAPKRFGLYSGWREADGFGYTIKNYSTDWSQMGPVKEKYQISTTYCSGHVEATFNGYYGQGPTELIAAARCYVSKLGDTVEVPEELA